MITHSHLYTTPERLDAFLAEKHIPADRPLLVRIHTTIHRADEIPPIIDALRSRLPYASIVGCSSPAVIYNGSRQVGVCMICITEVQDCALATASLPCFEENGTAVNGELLAQQLCDALSLHELNGQLVIFMPQRYFHCSRFAETISRLAPGIRMIGGIADDYQDHLQDMDKRDFTFTDQHCGPCCLAAAVIASPELRCNEFFALGMDKITATAAVTSYNRNIIHTVAGRSPLEWLHELAGDHLNATTDSDVIRIFPIFRKNIDVCGWPVVFVQDPEHPGSIMIVDELEDGEEIGIGFMDTTKVVDEVIHMYRELKKSPAQSIFAYSCTLRSSILQNCSRWELSPLTSINACGAFLGGEFFHDGTRNYFGNCNVVLSALATKDEYLNLNTSVLNNTHHLYHDNEHLVDFLTASASALRGDRNGSLIFEEMYSRLYTNESLKLGNLTKLFHDIQVDRMNKICMMSVRNGSELVAYAGFKAYGSMINAVVEKVQRFFSDLPMQYYMTEQGDLLIAANDSICAADFEADMRRLYDYLQIIEYSRMLPVFEFSLVLDSDMHLVRRAKVVQSLMRTHKDQRFMIYSSDMAMEENSVRDVQMVQVINDAIARHLVVPFYQGIYDNERMEISMYESLMRLTDADNNLYYPNDFLPIARKYGLYGHLSKQMIDKVMQEFSSRRTRVTINLAVQDIVDSGTTDLIYSHMQDSRYPENFIFEVVESEDINDYDAIGAFGEKIHSYGGQLALDDFGSGFSNLRHVLRMDLDYLKVDGGIVSKICEDNDCRQLLEMVSMYCKMRGKKVIAEYVENEDIQRVLYQYKVDYSQGYLFSKPAKLF